MQRKAAPCSASFCFLWTERTQEAGAVYHQTSFGSEFQKTKTSGLPLLGSDLSLYSEEQGQHTVTA
jgi:hypothetical protein